MFSRIAISTHTLTWSVTKALKMSDDGIEISTHTLTWSVTVFSDVASTLRADFNSHAHVERDWCTQVITHEGGRFQLTRSRGAWLFASFATALAFSFQLTRSRGAWQWVVQNMCCSLEFQLTRSRGAWLFNFVEYVQKIKFQLTRSRGAWLKVTQIATILNDFNSHAHVERDVV